MQMTETCLTGRNDTPKCEQLSNSLTSQGEHSVMSRAASLQKSGTLCFNFVLKKVKDSIKHPYIAQFFLFIFFLGQSITRR